MIHARLFFNVLFLCTLLSGEVYAQFWGAKAPLPFDTPKDSLKKGQFTWEPLLAPSGPIVVLVSLEEQMAYTYRNAVLIGISTISSGKQGHETPTGVFMTSLKDVHHHSSKYNNASMPYTQRLTNDGISLHAGGLPGYPSSHGCVHLPSEYARLLFDASPLGMTVVITDKHNTPAQLDHPAFLSPVDNKGKVEAHERLSTREAYRWQPDSLQTGPVSILVSAADKRMVVMQNGVEIGRCKVQIRNGTDSVGTHVFLAHEFNASGKKNFANDIMLKWLSFPVADINYGSGNHGNPLLDNRLSIPGPFLNELVKVIQPGTTMMVTDAPILRKTTSVPIAIMSSHPLTDTWVD